MMLVPSNVVRLFARTSVLVVATGLFHGIFLLPIIVRSFAFNMHLPNARTVAENNVINHLNKKSHDLRMSWDTDSLVEKVHLEEDQPSPEMCESERRSFSAVKS